MNVYEVPAADEITEPWWEATRTHRLLVQRCECGHHQHPPRALCTECAAMDRLGWVEASGAAVVDASTTVYRSPLPGLEPPYVVARVRLEEGPILLTNVIEVDPGAGVPIGAVVHLVWRDLPDGRALPVFRPAPGPCRRPSSIRAAPRTLTCQTPRTIRPGLPRSRPRSEHMDFRFTEDQDDFRRVLRDFVEKRVKPVAAEWEHSGRYPTEIVEGMAELGLFGITVPEQYGGLDLDPVSFAIVFEELARGWMGIAGILGSHSLACRLIAMHGTQDQRERYLPELATGQRRSGIGLTEPDAGTDLQGIRTVARRDGDHYVVTGTKMWITNARYANPLPVLVKTDPSTSPAHRGMSVLLVEADTPGYTVTRDIDKLGYKGTESCEVVLDEARVPVANLVGGVEGRGMQQVLSALEWGRVNIAARSVGIAQRALEESLEYSKQRKAFGQFIHEFQAIQLKLGSLATNVQAARLMTYWAADAVARGRADGETGMAKIFASEVALEAAIDAMKIHGGYGYSTEFEVERLYRDAILMSIGEGTNDVLRTVVATSLVRGETRIGAVR